MTALGGYQAGHLARVAARRAVAEAIAGRDDWKAVLHAKALEESARSIGHVEALEREIAPRLAERSPEERELLLTHLFGGAAKVADAVAIDLLAPRVGPSAAPAARLLAAAAGLSLDEVCKRACHTSAIDLLIAQALAGAPLATAVTLADERLAAAAAVALARHQDAVNDVATCRGLAEELAQRFGEAAVSPAARAAADELARARVRAAWDEAIAAGLPELDAARRCLAVAMGGVETADRERRSGVARRRPRGR